MIVIKKVIWAVVLVVVLSAFAGCSFKLDEGEVLSIRNRSSNKVITLGDSQSAVEKITGEDTQSILDFEDTGMSRFIYWDADGLHVDYLDEQVVALAIYTDNWDVASGLRVGMSKDEVEKLYPGRQNEADGFYYVAFDKNKQLIEYTEDVPYLVTIRIDDNDEIVRIIIENNEIVAPLQ